MRTFHQCAVIALVVGTSLTAASRKIVSIQVEPAQVSLTGKWSAQQLLVTATYSDGMSHDVTPQATFKSSSTKVAAVSARGIVTPAADGKTSVSVSVKGTKKVSAAVTVKRSREVSASYSTD